jgi:hypothetical protein
MSDAPGVWDFTFFRGKPFVQQLTYQDPNGVPIDLTGYDCNMFIKPSPVFATNTFALSVGSGITLGGVDGTIDLFIDGDATELLNDDVYDYYLELVNAGIKQVIMLGKFNVSPRVWP